MSDRFFPPHLPRLGLPRFDGGGVAGEQGGGEWMRPGQPENADASNLPQSYFPPMWPLPHRLDPPNAGIVHELMDAEAMHPFSLHADNPVSSARHYPRGRPASPPPSDLRSPYPQAWPPELPSFGGGGGSLSLESRLRAFSTQRSQNEGQQGVLSPPGYIPQPPPTLPRYPDTQPGHDMPSPPPLGPRDTDQGVHGDSLAGMHRPFPCPHHARGDVFRHPPPPPSLQSHYFDQSPSLVPGPRAAPLSRFDRPDRTPLAVGDDLARAVAPPPSPDSHTTARLDLRRGRLSELALPTEWGTGHPDKVIKPAALMDGIRTTLLEQLLSSNVAVDTVEFEAYVRDLWRGQLRAHGIVDTNSTTNWRKLVADIRHLVAQHSSETRPPTDPVRTGYLVSRRRSQANPDTMGPATLLRILKSEILHAMAAIGRPVSHEALEKLVKTLWRKKLQEHKLVDTNSTKNWKRLLSEIQRVLLAQPTLGLNPHQRWAHLQAHDHSLRFRRAREELFPAMDLHRPHPSVGNLAPFGGRVGPDLGAPAFASHTPHSSGPLPSAPGLLMDLPGFSAPLSTRGRAPDAALLNADPLMLAPMSSNAQTPFDADGGGVDAGPFASHEGMPTEPLVAGNHASEFEGGGQLGHVYTERADAPHEQRDRAAANPRKRKRDADKK